MVATSVLPSPVAISAILPSCSAMPPTICTSYGTMFQVISRPTTCQLRPHRPPAGVLDDREGLGQQIVEGGALGQPLAELGGLGAQLVVRRGRRTNRPLR